MALRPHLVLACLLCACRPTVAPAVVDTQAVRVPETSAEVEPIGREQARHVLALGDEGFAVVGRAMESASWDVEARSWVARFDRAGRRVWSVHGGDGETAERAAWSDDHGLVVVGRGAGTLWARSYGIGGTVRWEQRWNHDTTFVLGVRVEPDESAWVLVRPYGSADVHAVRVAPSGVSESETVISDSADWSMIDTGPALALPENGFYFPWIDAVARWTANEHLPWDFETLDQSEEDDEPYVDAAEMQSTLTSPLQVDTLVGPKGERFTAQQDGQTFVLIPGEVEDPPPTVWGGPWRTVDQAETALQWFTDVEPGDLYDNLSVASRTHALQALLARGTAMDEPVMISIGCSEYEEADFGSFVPIGREHDDLLELLVAELPASTVRTHQDALVGVIETLEPNHPLAESFLLSLQTHGIPEIAAALAASDTGDVKLQALQWLESGGHRSLLGAVERQLRDEEASCGFVSKVREARRRLGDTVAPPRTSGFESACEQLYELCATDGDEDVLISDRGYPYQETCSDDFPSGPDDDYAGMIDPCEPVDTRTDESLGLDLETMVELCDGDVLSWGEFDATGNCGVSVENDEHTVEFEDAGGGRWVVSSHLVEWTVDGP